MRRLYSIIILLAAICVGSSAQLLPYMDPSLSNTERAKDLLSRLTLEEKAMLMLDESPAIPRLGIKKFNWWSEALHGIANMGDVTVFPEPIGMASTFNPALVKSAFDAASMEMRAKWNDWQKNGVESRRFHDLSVWTPNVNIFRDPRWGRGQETYGEDPYLTSVMGVAVVKGLQGPDSLKYRRLLACAKHYAVHSGPEWARHVDNITNVPMRDLYETYLPAFKETVQKGDVREVMCAYQRWDDEPCCGSRRLLQRILREEWGFKYMVVSDCGAISDFWESHKTSSDAKHAAAQGVLAGTDVECGYNYAYHEIPQAVRLGLITEEDVDEKVLRLLEGRFSLGEMDKPEDCHWSSVSTDVVDCKEHRQIALDLARQSMTLLMNKGNILPLSKGKKVAVVGPNADDEPLMWGNYNGVPNETVTILEGIKTKSKKVKYVQGCDLVHDQVLESYFDQCYADGKQGMKGSFWKNQKREGDVFTTEHYTRPIDVTTFGNYAFAPGLPLTGFSAKYETTFKPKQSGEVMLHLQGCSYFELLVNGERKTMHRTWRRTDTRTRMNVEAGKEYKIEILYAQIENWDANLTFDLGKEWDINYDETVKQVKDCDVVIFCGGISARLEGEEMPIDLPGFKGGDRTDIELPAVQRNMLKALKAAGKKVIFVCCSGSAIALAPETESCDAILQAWYPGEMGGKAVAEVLFGDYNPSGKLPVTYYTSSSQLPDYRDYSMKGRTYRFMTEKPLYPFGYGLSYTTFDITTSAATENQVAKGKSFDLTLNVKNTGKRDGTEVVQVYISKDGDTEGAPIKTLRAFQRVDVKAGKTAKATLTLTPEAFEFYDEASMKVCTTPGTYTVFYGNSSANVKSIKVTLL
ncbi:MAG: glycoside hydrolase family 3 C-terminal domain-containing protein [Bacteroidales bacterium]|nr:glycoside hydrolase family 3 C-terminal domain-containing protein [Bacteroidales bacterium]